MTISSRYDHTYFVLTGPTSMTTDPPQFPHGGIEENILIVITVTIVAIIILVVLLVGVCITVRWMHEKKLEYDMNHAMIRANNMSMGGYRSHSPPQGKSGMIRAPLVSVCSTLTVQIR